MFTVDAKNNNNTTTTTTTQHGWRVPVTESLKNILALMFCVCVIMIMAIFMSHWTVQTQIRLQLWAVPSELAYGTKTAFGKTSLMVMTGVSKCLGQFVRQICNDRQKNLYIWTCTLLYKQTTYFVSIADTGPYIVELNYKVWYFEE